MKYLGLLRQNGFPEKGKSMGMQRKIAQYKGFETDVAASEQELENTTSDRKKAKLTAEITAAKQAMESLDAEICGMIDSYVKNQDKYAASGKKMAQARQAKAGKTPEPPKPGPVPEPAKNIPPVPDPPPAPKDEPPKPKDAKKSSSTSTWLFAGLAIIGAVIGINIWQNRN